jgi:hypothetical protein
MKCFFLFCFLVLFPLSLPAQKYKQKWGYVPDSATAVKIAEQVLIPVYGKKQIISERPFNATLKDDVWFVEGTLHCPGAPAGGSAHCVGGVAMVQITRSDGRVLSVRHGK